MTHREYEPEVKAAVLAALLAGQTVLAVSREYDVPRGTIRSWQERQSDQLFFNGESAAPLSPLKKADRIPDLVVDLMIARLSAQIALAEHCSDKKWLQTQDAQSLAILLGVQDDKLYRMLEALERARTRSDAAAGE